MRYTLLLHYPEQDPEDLDEAAMAEAQQAMSRYAAALHQAGILREAQILQPSANTTTVSLVSGIAHAQDGPLAGTTMALGGLVVIEVPTLDAALDWARRSPSLAWGDVEVRPGAVHVASGAWVPSS